MNRIKKEICRLCGRPTSKLAGEQAVLDLLPDGGSGHVVRTAWLYGANGSKFVRTTMNLERRRPAIDVVAGQIVVLVRLGAATGIYHATRSGETPWSGLAKVPGSSLRRGR